MKKNFFYVALSALALVACTNDEIVDVNPGDAVDFAVTTGNVTRAEITTNNINAFNVWAYKFDETLNNGDKYFSKTVERTKTNGTWGDWTYGDKYYWPNDTKLNFYSVAPTSVYLEDESIAEGTIPFQTQGKLATTPNPPANTDLVYGVNAQAVKGTDGVVKVHFRHALSQIAFRVKNTNSNLNVNVHSIGIVRAANSGTYHLPTQTTASDNTVKGEWEGVYYEDPAIYGESTETDLRYTIERKYTEVQNTHAEEGEMYKSWDYITVTSESQDFAGELWSMDGTSKVSYSSLFMIPQELTPSVVDANTNTMDLSSGTYFEIYCNIVQTLADGKKELLWGKGNNSPVDGQEYTHEPIAIPVCPQGKHFKWEEGKKYIYTIIFGEGAGYDGNPDDDDDEEEDPDDTDQDPVLVPISFEVTVEDFDSAEIDIDMEGNITPDTSY